MNLVETIYDFTLIFGTGLLFVFYSTISQKKTRPLLENIEFAALLNIAVIDAFGVFVFFGACLGQIHLKSYWFPLTTLSIVVSIMIIRAIFLIKQNNSYKLLSVYVTEHYDGITTEEIDKFCQLHSMDYFPVIFFEKWCQESGHKESLDSLNKLSLELSNANHLIQSKVQHSGWSDTVKHVNKK